MRPTLGLLLTLALPAAAQSPRIFKRIDPKPPVRIGDGSSIAFTHWKGTRRVAGTLTLDGRTTKLTALTMELNPNGTMNLAAEGPRIATFQGTWAKRNRKVVDLVLNDRTTGPVTFMDRANPYRWSLRGRRMSLQARVLE